MAENPCLEHEGKISGLEMEVEQLKQLKKATVPRWAFTTLFGAFMLVIGLLIGAGVYDDRVAIAKVEGRVSSLEQVIQVQLKNINDNLSALNNKVNGK